MGTNYYIIKKTDNELAKKLWEARNLVTDNTDFKKIFTDTITNAFKKPLNIAKENNTNELIEKFNYRVEEVVNNYVSDIVYDISYTFDFWDIKQLHIGKSSAGWLFNFQHQDTELNGIKIKWHSYEDVMLFLEEWVSKKGELVIVDEYTDEISYKEFKDLVDTKQKDPRNIKNPDNFTYCDNINGYRFSNRDFS